MHRDGVDGLGIDRTKQSNQTNRMNVGTLCTSYAASWSAPVESKLSDPAQTPLPEPIDRDQAAWIGSLIALGAAFGPFIGGPAGRYLGRKWALMLGSVPLFAGWLLVAASVNVYMIYAARLLFGLAVGIYFTNIPVYCGEIASDEVRGALNSLMAIGIGGGNLLVFSVGFYNPYNVITYVGVGLLSAYTATLYLVPETPTFHLMKGDPDSAQESLSTIRGKPASDLTEEMKKLTEEVKEAKREESELSDLWASRANVRALGICCTLLTLQPFSGISAVQLYAESIFSNAGIDLDPVTSTMIYSVFQFFCTFLTVLVIDRWGRRRLLLLSTLGVTITLNLFAVYSLLEQSDSPLVSNLRIAPVLLLAANSALYSIGFGPVAWILVGELFAVKIRTQASPIVNTLHWTVNFLVFRYFYSVVDSLGMHIAFWIFSGVCLFAFLFVIFVIPETKGKSFQEIQDLLGA